MMIWEFLADRHAQLDFATTNGLKPNSIKKQNLEAVLEKTKK
jgi:hypothetical protein